MIPGSLNTIMMRSGGDPHWASVVSLLHFDGADESTTITDETGRIWTANGDAQLDTAQSEFGGSSLLLDGTGDYISTTDVTGFDFGTGDFTVEFFGRFDTTSDMGFFAGDDDTNIDLAFIGSSMRAGRINTAWDTNISYSRSTTVFKHLAWSRVSGVMYLVGDGSLIGSAANTNSYNATTGAIIGASTPSDRLLDGWVDEARITKGVGRYTGAYTVPAAPFPNS